MTLHDLLPILILFLGATAICILFFDRIGLGSIVGFIGAGVLIGPHTPGPVAFRDVEALQHVAELGIVLFLFGVGLEMSPKHLWSMRKRLFVLGVGQVVLTSVVLAGLLMWSIGFPWTKALILGVGLAFSSTAIVMTILDEQNDLKTEHGRDVFSVLMVQDIAIVPALALVPILSAGADTKGATHDTAWEAILAVVAAVAAVVVLGLYVLPRLLRWVAGHRSREVYAVVLLLAVLGAAWIVDLAGVSMTLGAFLLGILLSGSEQRHRIEETIEPAKLSLMGLFFITIGMSIDFRTLADNAGTLAIAVVGIVTVKALILAALSLALGRDRSASLRTAFTLCQIGELGFVLFGSAFGAELIGHRGLALGYLTISVSMVFTPSLMRLGDRIAGRMRGELATS